MPHLQHPKCTISQIRNISVAFSVTVTEMCSVCLNTSKEKISTFSNEKYSKFQLSLNTLSKMPHRLCAEVCVYLLRISVYASMLIM